MIYLNEAKLSVGIINRQYLHLSSVSIDDKTHPRLLTFGIIIVLITEIFGIILFFQDLCAHKYKSSSEN